MNDISIDELNDCVALQYTGLKDKNGREIFEGDIVKHTHWSGNIGIIEYLSYGFFIKSIDGRLSSIILPNQTEITGNIFENPDLIK